MSAASNEPPENAGDSGSEQAKAKLDDAELNVGAPRALQKVDLDLDDAPFLEEEQAPPPPAPEAPEPQRTEIPLEEPGPLAVPFWKTKKFLLIVAGVVLLTSLGAGWFLFMKSKPPPAPPPPVEEPAPPPPPAEPAPPPEIPLKFQELAPFLVEKVDDKKRVRLFTFKLKLAFREERLAPEIALKMVVLRDAIYYNLRNKSFFNLTDKNAMDALRDELRGVVNNYLNTGQIEAVLFDEALVK